MNTLGMNYFVERLYATKYISFWNGFDSVVFFGILFYFKTVHLVILNIQQVFIKSCNRNKI